MYPPGMNLAIPGEDTRPIRTVHAHEIGGVADFYAHFADEPLIIRGAFPAGHKSGAIRLEQIEAILGSAELQVYDAHTQNFEKVPAAQIIADVRSGIPRYNVVDHYVAGTSLGDLLELPPFLTWNWFVGAPAGHDWREKSLVLTAQGSFTPLHLDAYAMQGWMYLIEGRKNWEFIQPDHLLAAFDSGRNEFFDPRRHTSADFPLLREVGTLTGTLGPGELLYFPSGWIHQVETSEAAYGFGGSLLNDFQIEANMRWWCWERSLKVEGGLDLCKLIREMPQDRFSGAQGRLRADAALAYEESWKQST